MASYSDGMVMLVPDGFTASRSDPVPERIPEAARAGASIKRRDPHSNGFRFEAPEWDGPTSLLAEWPANSITTRRDGKRVANTAEERGKFPPETPRKDKKALPLRGAGESVLGTRRDWDVSPTLFQRDVTTAFARCDRADSGQLDYRELRRALQLLGFDDITKGEAASFVAEEWGAVDLDAFTHLVQQLRYRDHGSAEWHVQATEIGRALPRYQIQGSPDYSTRPYRYVADYYPGLRLSAALERAEYAGDYRPGDRSSYRPGYDHALDPRSRTVYSPTVGPGFDPYYAYADDATLGSYVAPSHRFIEHPGQYVARRPAIWE